MSSSLAWMNSRWRRGLSYFPLVQMPDEQLMALADKGQLRANFEHRSSGMMEDSRAGR